MRGFISDKLKESLFRIWKKRDDYHHLNPNINTDQKALEELAMEKIRLLGGVVSEVFSYTVVNGKIIPEQPKYWRQAVKYKVTLL